MTKSLHPRALILRIWASKIENQLLEEKEAKTISKLFRRLADGENFDEVMGVERSANRPDMDKTKHYVEQVYGLTLPLYSPKEQKDLNGMPVSRAINTVANACNVSPSTVKTAYYSKKGREHLADIKVLLKSPLD